jgi:protein TonB
MFHNLIESSSHHRELKRRGSFFLFTTGIYVILFALAGVLSIYAYDARLEEPANEITMLSPLEMRAPEVTPTAPTPAPGGGNHSGGPEFIRRIPTTTVNNPNLAPNEVSSQPNTNPPLPPGVRFRVGNEDSDPLIAGSDNRGTGSGENASGRMPVIDVGTPPTPPVIEKPKPRVIHKRVLNGEAIHLPKPPYPPVAKQARVQGTVVVQVLVDETGRVLSAKAVSGNPLLLHAAQGAALQARFSPTVLNDQPVKVSGVITYNFVLQ